MTSPYETENFIAGIHNYCDRWCERCQFTGRCRVFAMEQESPDVDDDDLGSEALVRKLKGIFAETKQMLIEKAEELGIDPFSLSDEEFAEIRRREKEFVDNNDLSKLAETYWRSAKKILDDELLHIAQVSEDSISDTLPVLEWYLFFIPAKINAGLRGLLDDDGFEDKSQVADPQSYANGSVKIGLIAIERSILAWKQLADKVGTDRVYPMIELLETIRRNLENRFPLARDFVRPGFDEIEMVM